MKPSIFPSLRFKMRLLTRKQDSDNLKLALFKIDNLPSYAIISHIWIDGEEATYNELMASTGKNKAGYNKVCFRGERAAQEGL
jgi:hypothetical protein